MDSRLQASLAILILACCLKSLLVPSYHSTDFEVHRNWLAITHSIPLKWWYFEDTSEWTLDYPPFFAYFEWLLSQFATYWDSDMLQVENLDYASQNTILFMRGTVIVTDFVLMYATWLLLTSSTISLETHLKIFSLVAFNAGLLLVDHIHFQYNGVMMGLLILCIYCASTERYLLLAATFSTLVMMKHLFVPLAPVFAIYLIQRHCMVSSSSDGGNEKCSRSFSIFRFLQLIVIAGIALCLAFGPFIYQSNGAEQLPQIFARLFPFGRGLVHAYWAPNVWALYCFADKVLYTIIQKIKLPFLNEFLRDTGGVNSASGIVGDFAFSVLPSVSAGVCLMILLVALVPAMLAVYHRPNPRVLIVCIVYSSISSFMVGYHVHEKAVIIPLLVQTFMLIPSEAAVGEDGNSKVTSLSGDLSTNSTDTAVKNSTEGVKEAGNEADEVELESVSGSASVSVGAGAGAGVSEIGSVAGLRRSKRVQQKQKKENNEHASAATATSTCVSVEDSAAAVPIAASECGVKTISATEKCVTRGIQGDKLFLIELLNKALFGLLAQAGVFGLFPLFYTLPEVFTKGAIYGVFIAGTWVVLFGDSVIEAKRKSQERMIWFLKVQLGLCLFSLSAVFLFSEVLHPVLFIDRITQEAMLPFLPRMMTSVVCALYLFIAWCLSACLLYSSAK